jgi:hypothetical protein
LKRMFFFLKMKGHQKALILRLSRLHRNQTAPESKMGERGEGHFEPINIFIRDAEKEMISYWYNVFKVSNRPIIGDGMSHTVDSRYQKQSRQYLEADYSHEARVPREWRLCCCVARLVTASISFGHQFEWLTGYHQSGEKVGRRRLLYKP